MGFTRKDTPPFSSPQLSPSTTFENTSGQTVTIVAASTEIDTYLELARWPPGDSLRMLAEDDDGVGNTNAMIAYRLPATGDYLIGVYSYEAGQEGSYILMVFDGDESEDIRSNATGLVDGRWRPVSGTDSFTRYMDPATIRNVRPGVYEVWTRDDYKEPQRLRDGRLYDRAVDLLEVDCGRRRSRSLQISFYRGERVVESYDWSDRTTSAAWRPGSVGPARRALSPAGARRRGLEPTLGGRGLPRLPPKR